MSATDRSTYVKLGALAVVAVAVAVAGGSYVRMGSLLGIGQYTVTVELTDSGGIFTNAEVTSRGIPVGRVGALRLVDDGVDVDVFIDDDAPPISASSAAVVAARSAIGEQYIYLRPNTDAGPYLADGSVIDRDRTSSPSRWKASLRTSTGLLVASPSTT